MDLPPLDKGQLAKMGIAPDAVPIIPAPSETFGIHIKHPQPQTPKALTSDECVKLFGAREAVLMNFIPQMLTALALEQAESFVNYCRDNRLTDFKRHSRELRKCIMYYDSDLRASYGPAWYAYQRYLEKLRQTVSIDLFKCWCTFTNEAARQYVGHPHKEIPARITFILMLLTFVEDYDKNMDKVIEEKMGTVCNRKPDPFCTLIAALCVDIAETYGAKMKITDTMSLCVKVLANRCKQVADEIMAEEDAREMQKK